MSIPTGIICIWSGSIGSIPAGWALCDGNYGTPDLRDRFVVGAGDAYSVGDIGGANTHTHNFTTNGHSHSIPGGAAIQSGAGYGANTSIAVDTGQALYADGRPPYYALAYIMKS